MLQIHERGDAAYDEALQALSRRGDADLERVEPAVREILRAVRERGDEALRELTERFEGRALEAVRLDDDHWRAEAAQAPAEVQEALAAAAERIRRYHEHQRDTGFRYEEDGIVLGQRVRPVRAAGVYAPGGKARYPSTVLMTAIPASVAGVPRIVLATPRPTPEVLAAAAISGVTEVVDLGGAQAIGALAYGTSSVERVDKVVGPGNIYVACAKRLVFGVVDIDSIAGPSEILVVADDEARPAVVAADLLSQAEHDEDAYPLLITLSRAQADRVDEEVGAQLADLPRRSIAEVSVRDKGFCFVVGDLQEAARVASTLAAEHLALQVREPEALFEEIDAAGAVFLGDHTPEAAGDYAAGPSHVLPTGGAARFASPLGVYDFVVRTSLIRYSEDAIHAQADLLETLARLEGLEGHARAVAARR
ncbi:MAG: histidinol dehydrogenase [Deltaproteobacteria bacterium]|nr:MAG: histidinol dehydrogenase [Deltaproteobacteria bacterium]